MAKPAETAAAEKVDALRKVLWAIRYGDVEISGTSKTRAVARLQDRIARIKAAGRDVP